MKKYFMIYLVLLFISQGYNKISAQSAFEKADSIALNFNESYKNIEEFTIKLTDSLPSEIEKARVIYMWIANNINYDCEKYHKSNKIILEEDEETEVEGKEETYEDAREKHLKKIEKYYHDAAIKTFHTKKGVCSDYSHLYKMLCSLSGIEAVVISGKAKTHFTSRKRNYKRHAWNAVKIGKKWNLLDVTWGAGYVGEGVKNFYKEVKTGYFFVNPIFFSQRHFPNDKKWLLIPKSEIPKKIHEQPWVNLADSTHPVKGFSPSIIHNKGGEKIIWLKFENPPEKIIIRDKNGENIAFKKRVSNGKITLRFFSPSKKITIYRRNNNKLKWLAKYG